MSTVARRSSYRRRRDDGLHGERHPRGAVHLDRPQPHHLRVVPDRPRLLERVEGGAGELVQVGAGGGPLHPPRRGLGAGQVERHPDLEGAFHGPLGLPVHGLADVGDDAGPPGEQLVGVGVDGWAAPAEVADGSLGDGQAGDLHGEDHRSFLCSLACGQVAQCGR
jgi:hypothetical protein